MCVTGVECCVVPTELVSSDLFGSNSVWLGVHLVSSWVHVVSKDILLQMLKNSSFSLCEKLKVKVWS